MKINTSSYILQHELKFSTVTPPMGLKSRVRLSGTVSMNFSIFVRLLPIENIM